MPPGPKGPVFYAFFPPRAGLREQKRFSKRSVFILPHFPLRAHGGAPVRDFQTKTPAYKSGR